MTLLPRRRALLGMLAAPVVAPMAVAMPRPAVGPLFLPIDERIDVVAGGVIKIHQSFAFGAEINTMTWDEIVASLRGTKDRAVAAIVERRP